MPPPIPIDETPLPPVPSLYDALPESARLDVTRPFSGDLDAMVKRRVIRAGVVFNRTHYFIDKGVQRGLSYDAIQLFEDQLNKRLKTGVLKVYVVPVPLSRDSVFPALQAGLVDFVAASLTVTPDRQKLAAFSTPVRAGVSEIVVTGSMSDRSPPPRTCPDEKSSCAGATAITRACARSHDTRGRGQAVVTIIDGRRRLEDDDLLEMANAGLVDATIVDDYLAEFWRRSFRGFRSQGCRRPERR